MEKKRMRRKAIHSASRKWGWIAWNGFHLRSYCLSARQYRGPIRFLVMTNELRPSVYRYLRLSIGTSVCWHIMLELSGLLGAANAVYTVLSKIMMISLSSLSCSLSSSLLSRIRTRQMKYHDDNICWSRFRSRIRFSAFLKQQTAVYPSSRIWLANF